MKSCKYQSLLGLYYDNALSEKENDEIAEHLNSSTRCSCLQELARLSKIERIIKNDLFEAPPERYWTETSDAILVKIGAKEPDIKVSWVSTFINESVAFIEGNLLKLSFSGAFALLIIIIFLTYDFNEPEKAVQATLTTETESQTVVPGESENGVIDIFVDAEKFEIKDTPVLSEVNLKDVVDETKNELPKVMTIEPKNIKFDAIELADNEMIPLPQFKVDLSSGDDDEAIKNDIQPGQYIFTQNVSGARSDVNELIQQSMESVEGESDFAEILWIVQQTESLTEKKNIWLSYIGRETNSTYKYMGIYNLALVYAKMSIESKDPEKAEEALQFIEENEETLSYQMTEQRFSNIKNTLNLIARR